MEKRIVYIQNEKKWSIIINPCTWLQSDNTGTWSMYSDSLYDIYSKDIIAGWSFVWS